MTKSKKYVRRISKKIKRPKRKTQTKRKTHNRKRTMKGGLQVLGRQVYGTNKRRELADLITDFYICNKGSFLSKRRPNCNKAYILNRIYYAINESNYKIESLKSLIEDEYGYEDITEKVQYFKNQESYQCILLWKI